ncbi:MAG: ATP-binding protein [Segetibacter sp.]
MGNNKENIPMYFASLKIENVKCFGEEQELDLRDSNGKLSPWTLILGNNGLGKTTLLKCLAWMSTVEESDANKKEEAKIPESMVAVKPFMDGIEEDSEYEKLARIGDRVKTTVSTSLTIGAKLGEIPRNDQIIEYSIEIETVDGRLEDVRPKLVPLPEFKSPVIYAYSASRHMEMKNLDSSELMNPVSNLFSESGELFDATELLLYQDHAALQENLKGKETALLQKIKELLTDLLPGIDDPSDITIHAKERAVKIRTPDGNVSLSDLSLGYKTMIAWTVDLALKMLIENPESDYPLEEPAVVIIDEIDLHLHPKWQRILKAKLTSHFRKTQFICTAHSPFMAQSSETGCYYYCTLGL